MEKAETTAVTTVVMNRESRSKIILFRVTPSEYGLIERAATLTQQLTRRVGVSEFVRSRILTEAASVVERDNANETELMNEEETIG